MRAVPVNPLQRQQGRGVTGVGVGPSSESAPRFAGIYAGAAGDDATRRAVEDADVLIVAGCRRPTSTAACPRSGPTAPGRSRSAPRRRPWAGRRPARWSCSGPSPPSSRSWRRLRAGRTAPAPFVPAASAAPGRPTRTPPCPRRNCRTRSPPSCDPGTSSWPTRGRRSTASPPTGCHGMGRSSASPCGPRSATPCRRCWERAQRGRAAAVYCSSATARRR